VRGGMFTLADLLYSRAAVLCPNYPPTKENNNDRR
jgi:hypothetical protein